MHAKISKIWKENRKHKYENILGISVTQDQKRRVHLQNSHAKMQYLDKKYKKQKMQKIQNLEIIYKKTNKKYSWYIGTTRLGE